MKYRFTVAVLAAVVVLAGCGSSKKQATTPASSAPGSSAASSASPPAGTPITVGSIACLTGPSSSTTLAAGPATDAWEKWVNANGGINGHPVHVDLVDDGCDSAKAQAGARDLVETKKVAAIVGFADSVAPSVLQSYFEQQQIPVMSAYSTDPVWAKSPVYFALGQTNVPIVSAMPKMIHDLGAKSWSLVVCAEIAGCSAQANQFKAAGDALGLDYKGLITVGATEPDYSAECLKMKGQGVQGAFLALASATAYSLMDSCNRQGYTPHWVVCCSTFDSKFTQLSNEVVSNQQTLPWFIDDPCLADFQGAMKKYEGAPASHSVALVQWAALEVFRKAITKAGVSAPTRQDVFAAMYALQGEDLGGILPQPLKFTSGQPSPQIRCYYAVGVQNKKLTTPLGTQPQCTAS
jgi:branched-chain amino acid transport system substrate-binding protein